MTGKTVVMEERLERYMRSVSLREAGVLRRLREATAALPEAQMQVAPEQGQFLQMLIRLTGARRIVEIGTFTGYSALWMALALPEDGLVVTCDESMEWTDIAREYWHEAGVADRIELCLGPAEASLEDLVDEGRGLFDLAFIDADKGGYESYYESCLKLLRSGGLIAIDNTLWGGSPADPDDHEPDTEAIRTFNTELHADERIDLSMLPIADGMTLARKR